MKLLFIKCKPSSANEAAITLYYRFPYVTGIMHNIAKLGNIVLNLTLTDWFIVTAFQLPVAVL